MERFVIAIGVVVFFVVVAMIVKHKCEQDKKDEIYSHRPPDSYFTDDVD